MSVIWAVYYMQDSKMATEAILGQSFVCLLHGLKHWLHGLETLVTNFVDVGPIFKISAAKCISSFWKDYWYYSCYPYYSYYRNKSPTSIRAINPTTPLYHFYFCFQLMLKLK